MAIEDERGASHDDEADAETNAAEPLARLMRTHLKEVGAVTAVTSEGVVTSFYQLFGNDTPEVSKHEDVVFSMSSTSTFMKFAGHAGLSDDAHTRDSAAASASDQLELDDDDAGVLSTRRDEDECKQQLQLQLLQTRGDQVKEDNSQFLWHQPQRQSPPSSAAEEQIFFRIVAGDLRSHTFIGRQPSGFDCMCQRFSSFMSERDCVYVVPIGAPFGCNLGTLSFEELGDITIWKLANGIGYVPKANQNLSLGSLGSVVEN